MSESTLNYFVGKEDEFDGKADIKPDIQEDG